MVSAQGLFTARRGAAKRFWPQGSRTSLKGTAMPSLFILRVRDVLANLSRPGEPFGLDKLSCNWSANLMKTLIVENMPQPWSCVWDLLEER
jgi:hypothetical protein